MNTDFGKLLKSVAKGKHGSKNLNKENAAYAMGCILDATENDARVASFLTAMRFKGSTSEELSGFLDGMKNRYRTTPIDLPGLIDSAGAYDGRTRTLHLSLAGTIIACASGCRVITHSGSDLPPKRGVTIGEVLETLGIPSRCSVNEAVNMLEETGFTFIHESVYLPEMDRLREMRNSLGFRSFINTCESAANPFSAKTQFISVAHEHFMERVAKGAHGLGVERAIVVTGVESSDEVPLKQVKAVLLDGGKTQEIILDPAEYGLPYLKPESCRDAEESGRAVSEALTQENAALTNHALFDGGVKIFLGGGSDSVKQGVEKAREIVESGNAARKLSEIRDWRNKST